MALVEPQPEQPTPNDLHRALSQLGLDSHALPSRSDIDPDQIDFVIDVDLDQLAVYFGDTSKPYSIDEVEDNISVAIAEDSNKVVGVLLDRFLSEEVKLHPELVPVLRYATIIAGTSLQEPVNAVNRPGSNTAGIMARLEDWINARARRQERLDAFTSFADLIGIH